MRAPSRPRIVPLLAVLTPFFVIPPAEADYVSDLVVEVGAEAPPPTAARPVKASPARKPIARRGKAPRGAKPRAVAAARRRGRGKKAIKLTAEQRGSGRIDVLDASGPVQMAAVPTIEAKGGFAPIARPLCQRTRSCITRMTRVVAVAR
jgi:hypothetical protein